MLIAFVLFCSSLLTGDEWTALPIPSLCQPDRNGAQPSPAWDGRHVRLSSSASDHDGASSGPRLPIETLAQMLTEDARARGTRLELFRGTPALLARGDAAALSAAKDRIAELERATANLDIELSVRLAPNRERGSKGSHATTLAPSVARIVSGEQAYFGGRDHHGFIAGYSVEVAADSGVAQPVVGSASTGTTVHLRAARVEGGKRIHLFGVLDLSELVEIVRFDPETPDLGVVQEPVLRCAQAVFSGVVESGGTLEVRLESVPLAQPDWTLSIQASTRLDEPRKDTDPRGWTLVDCAFIAADPPSLAPCRPGAGLDHRFEAPERVMLHPGLPPSAIAAALETGNESLAAARQPVHWSSQLLLVPNSEPGLVRSALDLASGVEALRLTTGRMEIQHGKLHAELPVTEGYPARLAAGSERSYVVGYSAEIAPQTWIASPVVEIALDGLCVDIDALSSSAACSFWSSASQAPVELPRKDAQLGKIQILQRSLRAGSARIIRDEPLRTLLPSLLGANGKDAELETFGIAYHAR